MDWKCSSLQIGTWLEPEQLPKRCILQLNTKLPTEPCFSDQIHLGLSLPLAQSLTNDHVSTREPHEESKRTGWEMSQCKPLLIPLSTLYHPTLSWASGFPAAKLTVKAGENKGKTGKDKPGFREQVEPGVMCSQACDRADVWITIYK